MKFIPLDAVLAEIDRLIAELVEKGEDTMFEQGRISAFEDAKLFLDTLEMKEVEIEKELIEWHKEHFQKSGTFIGMSGFYLTNSSQMELAKHFFELGLKAQIMTSKLQQRLSALKMEFWTGLQTFDTSWYTFADAYSQGIKDILEELGIEEKKGE